MNQIDALEIRDPAGKLAPLRLCFDLRSFDARRIVRAMCALERLHGSRFAVVRSATISQPAAHDHFVIDIVPCHAQEADDWNRFKLRVLAMFKSSSGQRATAGVISSTAALPRESRAENSEIDAKVATEFSTLRERLAKAPPAGTTSCEHDCSGLARYDADYIDWVKLLREVGFCSAPIMHKGRRNGRGVLRPTPTS